MAEVRVAEVRVAEVRVAEVRVAEVPLVIFFQPSMLLCEFSLNSWLSGVYFLSTLRCLGVNFFQPRVV